MDLRFTDIDIVTVRDRKYSLQRACVDKCPEFWINYRAMNSQLRQLVTIRKEVYQGKLRFFAYRQVPINPGYPFGKFKLTYTLRDTSILYPYQVTAVAHLCQALVDHGHACDGSDTGTGKTYTALGTAREMGLTPAIVCKKAGIAGWKKAMNLFKIKPFFVVNWEQAKNGKFQAVARSKDPWSGDYVYKWDKTLMRGKLLIFDEQHMANHTGSQNCSLYISSRGIPSLSLSATFADRPERLQALFHVIGAVEWDKFTSWLQARGAFVNTYNQIESLSARQDMLELNKFLYPRFGYRVSYNHPEVKKFFPSAITQTMVISLSEKKRVEQNDLYNKMMLKVFELKKKLDEYKQKKKEDRDSREANSLKGLALAANTRYRQIAELMKADALVELTREYLYEGKSVVIFVNYKDTLFYLSEKMKCKNLIYGEQHADKIDRQAVLDAFQTNRIRLLLAMVDAGGTSLDLHDLQGGHQRVSLICPTYNPVTLKQVCGRTHRAGSKTKPIIKLVYAYGTIEEKVADKVNRKIGNISALNDGDLMTEDHFNLMKGIEP